MMLQAKVSVVIATYNMGNYIGEAVDSILKQNWKNLELIIVDDGSTDDTETIINEMANDHSNVIYIKIPNSGQPIAKNTGMKNATGEFIAFCDADDRWIEDKLQHQMPLFEDPEVGVVYSDVIYIDSLGEEIAHTEARKFYSGSVTKNLIDFNFVPFGTSVIRRACIKDCGIFDTNIQMGIDWDLWLRYSTKWKFSYTAEKTYAYRDWPGQMSKNYRGRYDSAFGIFHRFIEKNPNVVSKQEIRNAWAGLYSGRAMIIFSREKTLYEPLVDALKSILLSPFTLRYWKVLTKILIRKL